MLLSLLVLASCGENELSNTATPQKIVTQATSQEVEVANNKGWEVVEATEVSTKKEEAVTTDKAAVKEEASTTPPQWGRPARGWKAKEPVPVAEYAWWEITEVEKAEGKVVELSHFQR